MKTLRGFYRRLDALQHTRGFCIVASIVAFVLVAGVFGPIISRGASLSRQANALAEAIISADPADSSNIVSELIRNDEAELNGRTYSLPDFRDRVGAYLGPDGRIAEVNLLVGELLRDQVPGWAPRWLLQQRDTAWQLGIFVLGALLLITWVGVMLPFLLTMVGTAIPVLVGALLGNEQLMMFFAGVGVLSFLFVLMMRTLSILLSSKQQVLAVAHTVVKEATRTRISIVFIVIILIALPFFPMQGDPADPLRYRIQGFIASSLRFTLLMSAIMTLFLACSTVSFEIRDRQIWQLVTKPVNRMQYLLGKWVGIIAVNLALLTTASISVYGHVQYMRTLPAVNDIDRIAVANEILVARVAADPEVEALDDEQVRNRVNLELENDPQFRNLGEIPRQAYVRKDQEIRRIFEAQQRSVPPGRGREYVFEGLGNAPRLADVMYLRYRFHILEDNEHETFRARFMFNDDPSSMTPRTYVPTVAHSLPLTTDYVREDGTLKLTIINDQAVTQGAPNYGSLNFDPGDLQILYTVSTFEWNFVRAMLLAWVKLAVLAAVGVACGTFLSFPVACLLSFTVAAAGTLVPFLSTALQDYGPGPFDQIDWSNIGVVVTYFIQWTIESIAKFVVFVLGGFGTLRPTQDLVEGRLISWGSVFGGVLRVGLVWSLLSMGLGYLVIRKRELATYSGQG